MRWFLLLSCLTACAGSPGAQTASCPSSIDGTSGDAEGMPCAVASTKTCFIVDEFSSCESGWYQCVDGSFHRVDSLHASDGESCASSPLATCSHEGTFDCEIPPTAQQCSCDPDGTWHCLCGCYGGTSDCPACPAAFDPGLGGRGCAPEGNTCTWPGHTCTCTSGTFTCS